MLSFGNKCLKGQILLVVGGERQRVRIITPQAVGTGMQGTAPPGLQTCSERAGELCRADGTLLCLQGTSHGS